MALPEKTSATLAAIDAKWDAIIATITRHKALPPDERALAEADPESAYSKARARADAFLNFERDEERSKQAAAAEKKARVRKVNDLARALDDTVKVLSTFDTGQLIEGPKVRALVAADNAIEAAMRELGCSVDLRVPHYAHAVDCWTVNQASDLARVRRIQADAILGGLQ